MSAEAKHKDAPLHVAASKGDIEQPYLDAAQSLTSDRFADPRAEHLAVFEAAGFPHRRVEEWKYTDLRPKMRTPYALPSDKVPNVTGEGGPFSDVDAIRIVIANGRLMSSIPTEEGLEIVDALSSEASFIDEHLHRLQNLKPKSLASLGTAMMSACLALRIQEGTRLAKPIHIVSLTTESDIQHHVRLLIVAEKDSEVSVIQEHFGEGGSNYFSNTVVEMVAGENAQLRHYKTQNEEESSVHITSLYGEVGAGAHMESFYVNGGASLARNDGYFKFVGEDATLTVGSAYMASDKQLTDTTILVDHAVPHCASREVVRGVLTDKARGVFQGKIIVQPDAQKTDGYQMSKALLLSTGAEVDAKPELEIYADDVKCAHGATSGDLDEEALFYMRSRAIPLAEAKALLVEGFLDEAIDEITDERVKEPLKSIISKWLSNHSRWAEEEGA